MKLPELAPWGPDLRGNLLEQGWEGWGGRLSLGVVGLHSAHVVSTAWVTVPHRSLQLHRARDAWVPGLALP